MNKVFVFPATAAGYETDSSYCEGRFNRMLLSLPEIVVLPCTPLPSSVESSPISSSSSSSSLSLVHQSSSEHPTAGTTRYSYFQRFQTCTNLTFQNEYFHYVNSLKFSTQQNYYAKVRISRKTYLCIFERLCALQKIIDIYRYKMKPCYICPKFVQNLCFL